MAIDKQKGVSLILTFFIMIIILIIVLSISVILYSEVKIMKNIGSSIMGLYAADSGIEKVLYYDRQVRPLIITATPCPTGTECSLNQVCDNTTHFCANLAPRGLCSIFDLVNNTAKYCKADSSPSSSSIEHSIYCNPTTDCPNPLAPTGSDCVPSSCKNCTICFATTFDNRTYTTVATVTPDADPTKTDPDYTITSKGVYGGTQREIEILIKPTQ